VVTQNVNSTSPVKSNDAVLSLKVKVYVASFDDNAAAHPNFALFETQTPPFNIEKIGVALNV
jgi:midasin (ATPase involved in ribosome maturation)